VSDYLWDKSGSDPEVERLEQALQPLAFRGAPPVLPSRRSVGRTAFLAGGLAAAALMALLLWRPWRPLPPALGIAGGHAVVAGAWLESGADTLRLELGNLGSVELQPATRARVLGPGHLELDHGALRAKIDAPPRAFSIETRWARVIDLGCAFELAVDEKGRGRLRVTEGSVALVQEGHEVVVRAGSEQALGDPEPPPVLPNIEYHPPVKPKLVVKKPQHAQPQPKTPAKTPTQKAKETDPGLRLQHDSLKDLDRSL
jgi:hypothetical protein